MGRELYQKTVTLEVQKIQEEDISHHVTFLVHMDAVQKQTTGSHNKTNSLVSREMLVSPFAFCELFPFHVIFDSELVIKQCGSNIARWSRLDSSSRWKLSDLFVLIKPRMLLTYGNIRRFCNANYVLRSKGLCRDVGEKRQHRELTQISTLDTPDTSGQSAFQITLRGWSR